MSKKLKILLYSLIALISLTTVFFYLDYKKNPITYIILSKKFEIVSYLFFRDLPGIYPASNFYHIKYERVYDGETNGETYNQGMSAVSISAPHDVYATKLPQKLRKIFDDYAKLDPKKEKDREVVKQIVGTDDPKGRVLNLVLITRAIAHYDEDLDRRVREYIKLFSKKFIVVEITQYKKDEQCGDGSFDLTIIFDSHPMEAVIMGLTSADKVCYIWDDSGMPPFKIKNFKEENKNYWL